MLQLQKCLKQALNKYIHCHGISLNSSSIRLYVRPDYLKSRIWKRYYNTLNKAREYFSMDKFKVGSFIETRCSVIHHQHRLDEFGKPEEYLMSMTGENIQDTFIHKTSGLYDELFGCANSRLTCTRRVPCISLSGCACVRWE